MFEKNCYLIKSEHLWDERAGRQWIIQEPYLNYFRVKLDEALNLLNDRKESRIKSKFKENSSKAKRSKQLSDNAKKYWASILGSTKKENT